MALSVVPCTSSEELCCDMVSRQINVLLVGAHRRRQPPSPPVFPSEQTLVPPLVQDGVDDYDVELVGRVAQKLDSCLFEHVPPLHFQFDLDDDEDVETAQRPPHRCVVVQDGTCGESPRKIVYDKFLGIDSVEKDVLFPFTEPVLVAEEIVENV